DQNHHVDLVNNKRYNVRLISIGKNKINVIKEIKNLLNIGLKESKDFIEVLQLIITTDTLVVPKIWNRYILQQRANYERLRVIRNLQSIENTKRPSAQRSIVV
ncbi:ribosomal protein L7/L12, partial [Candidatus Hodgkinia cicadicola]|uniref:ribosomal protein L7/L12 n=1 Tax=Candidatus Hodgkinia cicadicola TaxID=573658 RepID=UPI001788BED6